MLSYPRLWYLGHLVFPCEGAREGSTNLWSDTIEQQAKGGREERGENSRVKHTRKNNLQPEWLFIFHVHVQNLAKENVWTSHHFSILS